MGAILAAEAADVREFDAVGAEIAALPEAPSRYAATAFHIAEATMMSRLGRFSEAWAAIATARNHVDRQRSVHKYSVDCFGNGIQIKERGCAGFRIRFSWLQTRDDGSVVSQEPPLAVMLPALELGAIVDFASGNWAAAAAKLESTNLRGVAPCTARTMLLSIIAAMAAFNGQTPGLADLIEQDLRFSNERALWQRSMPLAFWWAAFISGRRPAEAAALVDPLRPYLRGVPDSSAFSFPIARVLYAARANDKDLLQLLLASRFDEQAPWDAAHDALAAGIAYRALRDARGKTLLARSQESFQVLEARFFAAYAANALQKATPEQCALLEKLGVSESRDTDAHTRARLRHAKLTQPTLREREVAGLVAEGYTNRKIAERLTLSERTVEVHIANLFNKLDLSSRTQLVRFVMQDQVEGNGIAMTERA